MSGAPRWLIALAVPVALAASACGGGGGEGGVGATLNEYTITLSADTAGAGDVTFNISNEGEIVHEFVVFKTDLAEDAFPVAEDKVDEEGATDLTLVDEVEDIEPGASADLTVSLEAGNYVVICNIAGHYEDGMHASFTVS